MPSDELYQVQATFGGKPFTAGFVVRNDKVVKSAPVLRKAVFGKSKTAAFAACRHRGWQIDQVETNRTCGDCQECCTASGVTELKKMPGERCIHQIDCTNAHCGIYEGRPTACKTFKCGWLQGMLAAGDRPDLSGLMISSFPSQDKAGEVTAVINILDAEKVGNLTDETSPLMKAVRFLLEFGRGCYDIKIHNPKTNGVIYFAPDGKIYNGQSIPNPPGEYESLTFATFGPPLGKYLLLSPEDLPNAKI